MVGIVPTVGIQRHRKSQQAPPPLSPLQGTLTVSFAGKLHIGDHNGSYTPSNANGRF